MKDKNLALKVSGVIFLVVAIMHLLRLLFKVQVSVGGTQVWMSASFFGCLAAFLLALWMLAASKK